MDEHNIWSISHRPKTVRDTVLPATLKSLFQAMVDKKEFPNLILSGPSGTGKSTVSMAMLSELGYDVYKINGSLNGTIDTLRTEILDFVTAVSFTGARKCVYIDEADGISQATQAALRNFMETYAGNASFILTCNHLNKIHPALQSRSTVVSFVFPKESVPELCKEFFGKVCIILDREGVTYDRKAVAEVVKTRFPDFRRILNELQRYAAHGSIDTGILAKRSSANFDALTDAMKDKDFTTVRKWVGENSDIEPAALFRLFYDHASRLLSPSDVPALIVLIGQWSYYSAFAVDQEVNTSAFLASVMATVVFK